MPRYSSSQGSGRGVNAVIENMVTWMWGNNRSVDLKFMDSLRTGSTNDIEKAAYETVFGAAQKAGSMPKDVVGTMIYD